VEQTDIKAMLALCVNEDPQIKDDACFSGLREDFPPSLLYLGKAVSGATILHRLLRNHLQLKGVVYIQSIESTRITYELITMLQESQSDYDTALALLRDAQLSILDAVSTCKAVNNETHAYSSKSFRKNAYCMTTRFKAEQKFTGKLGEGITKYISNCRDTANDYNFSVKQKLDYMHHLLDGETNMFYCERILSSCATFAEATSMMQ
jgi:hypothetical protein